MDSVPITNPDPPSFLPKKSPFTKKSLGLIEQLRLQAHLRAQQATDSTEIIRSFRGEIANTQAGKEL